MFRRAWHKFTDWLVRDLYTYEERALRLLEAERLQMKNDLQRERIQKRREREDRLRNDFRTVAVWSLDYREGDVPMNAQFYLQQTRNPMPDGTVYRRVVGGPVTRRETGAAVRHEAQLGTFVKGQTTYVEYVLPWRDFTRTTESLRKCEYITVLAPKKRRFPPGLGV